MSYSDKDKAKEHWNRCKDDVHEAGQHAASAASTVGHDFRAAAGEAAEAGKYAARRCGSSPSQIPRLYCTNGSELTRLMTSIH